MAIPASRRKPDSRWPCGVPRKWCPDHPPEKICQEYPSVGLADVYAVIAFYLGRRDEIDAYPDTVREREAHVVEEIELRSPLPEIQRRFLARKDAAGVIAFLADENLKRPIVNGLFPPHR